MNNKSSICVLILSAFLSLIVLVAYYLHFGSNTLSRDFSEWVEFAIYVNGLIVPILAFSSLLLLFQTIKIQSREMERTRAELKRSNDLKEITAIKEIIVHCEELVEPAYKKYQDMIDTNSADALGEKLAALLDDSKEYRKLMQKKIKALKAEMDASNESD